ncbi:MAG: tyrosine-type recombinase/integrase [Reyranellaceae bacterium]
MTKFRLAYIHRFKDRHGKIRHYFRRPGCNRIALPGLPGSEEFMAAYQAALAGETAPLRPIGAAKSKPGTIGALVASYFESHEFKTLAKSTQATYRGIIERWREERGDKPVQTLKSENIRKGLDKRAATAAAANNWLRMVRLLMRYAIKQNLRCDDPTIGIENVRVRSNGFATWSDDHIEMFKARWPLGTRARLALCLALHTTQRRGDLVLMGRQHIRGGTRIVTVQQKTGEEVDQPLHAELVEAIEALPNNHLTFLVTKDGKPFSPAGFTNWFRECCAEAGLPKGLSVHGLRKASMRIKAENGATTHMLAAVSGHKTLKEVERYTRAANRRRLADQAHAKVETGTSVGKPSQKVSQKHG